MPRKVFRALTCDRVYLIDETVLVPLQVLVQVAVTTILHHYHKLACKHGHTAVYVIIYPLQQQSFSENEICNLHLYGTYVRIT